MDGSVKRAVKHRSMDVWWFPMRNSLKGEGHDDHPWYTVQGEHMEHLFDRCGAAPDDWECDACGREQRQGAPTYGCIDCDMMMCGGRVRGGC